MIIRNSAYGISDLKIRWRSITVVMVLGLIWMIMFSDSMAFINESDITSVNYFKQGKKEAEKGNYEKAIEIWEEAYANLPSPDFRIGQCYIEIVTSKKIKSKYKKAVSLYNWGLDDKNLETSEQALFREIEYLRPIVGYGNYRDLKKKIDKKDTTVYQDIRNFWELKDPTPFSDYNERLIEHWERVAYATTEFKRSNRKDLDERADIYIKYGSPDVTRHGIINYDSGFVNNLLKDRIGLNLHGSSSSNETREMRIFNLETKIRHLHQSPEYEIWIYHQLAGKTKSTIYLFGNDGSSSTFRKMDSVEDFIPNSAFSMTRRNRSLSHIDNVTGSGSGDDGSNVEVSDVGNVTLDRDAIFGGGGDPVQPTFITPGLILQMMYYRHFSALDPYFGTALSRMLSRYQNQLMRVPVSLGREFENTNKGEMIQLRRSAPEEISVYKKNIAEISMDAFSYRFINENNEPYVKVFVKSTPGQALLYDQLKNNNRIDDGLTQNYTIMNGVKLLGSNQKILSEQTDSTQLGPGVNEEVTAEFNLKYVNDISGIIVGSELYNPSQEAGKGLADGLPFEKQLKGIGNLEMDIPEALNNRDFEMGDIIFGYNTDKKLSNNFVSFQISHNREIPQGKDLYMYYELYQLEQNPSGKAKFTFKYDIKAKSKGIRLFGKDRDDLSITLNNETLEDRYSNTLVIDTSRLRPGDYKINIEVRDINSGRNIKRSFDFSILN